MCNGQAVNIACGRRVTLNEILQQLKGLLGSDVEAVYEPARVGDVKHSLADITLAKTTIGYEPKVYFEDGLARSIDWYKANLG